MYYSELTRAFARVDDQMKSHFVDVSLFNASARARPITEVDHEQARTALLISSYGGFLVAQAAAQRMPPHGAGTILLTGASASVKGYPQSAVFAMGKFALRGLAQSMARELAPKGIHVAHFVIDGGVRNAEKGRVEGGNVAADSYLDPRRSPRAICTWSSSPVAPGRGRWSCAPGSSGSEVARCCAHRDVRRDPLSVALIGDRLEVRLHLFLHVEDRRQGSPPLNQSVVRICGLAGFLRHPKTCSRAGSVA